VGFCRATGQILVEPGGCEVLLPGFCHHRVHVYDVMDDRERGPECPQFCLGSLVLLLRGRTKNINGHALYAGAAVDLLVESNPDATNWIRENAPNMLGRRRLFLFNEEACVLAIEPSPSQR
jgi:hypothetical protein